jgi:hypothetical protein
VVEASTLVSFLLPGALGTYPMSINASMTVTGYYYVTPTVFCARRRWNHHHLQCSI